MKKIFYLILCLTICLSGCANIQNDQTRTTTEGAVVGTAVGAGVGAIIGRFAGSAALGAAIGGAIGLAVGTAYGSHVASKKAEYASQEAWLDACIEDAQNKNTELVAYNTQLKEDVSALDTQISQLAADYKRQTITAENFAATQQAELKKIEERKKETDIYIASMEEEVTIQKEVIADARKEKNDREADIIETEIVKMEQQLAELRQTSEQLASISTRVSI